MKQQFATFVLAYLKFFAKLQLRKKLFDQIIGITGSVGKSSTRNAIYTVLKQKYRVKASFKANSESGIPLDILGLRMHDYSTLDWLRVLCLAPLALITNFKRYDYYIVEMGIDSPFPPKNMAYLLSIIQPNIGVFTNQGLNHAFAFDPLLEKQQFPSAAARQERIKQLIASEKGKLLTSLPAHGKAIFNGDDVHVQTMGRQSKAKQLTFGFDKNNTVTCEKQSLVWHKNQLASTFTFHVATEKSTDTLTLSFTSQLLFAQYAYNLAPAILLGQEAGIPAATITRALEQEFVLPASRASILTGKNQSLIIDSSYNASGMVDMLQTLISLQPKQERKFVLLGDMRELGESTQVLHEAVAKLLLTSDVDHVFLVGTSMQQFVLPLLEKSKIPVRWFANAVTAGKTIATLLQKNDLILIKGSQNTIFLEDAVMELLANPIADQDKVCRQEPAWQKRKHKAMR